MQVGGRWLLLSHVVGELPVFGAGARSSSVASSFDGRYGSGVPYKWSSDSLAFLRKHYGSWDDTRLSYALDRPVEEISAKAEELALSKNKAAFPVGRRMPRWEKAELERLRKLYPTHTNLAIALDLGRSLKSITSKASMLGLRKTSDQLRIMGRENRALRRPKI